MVPKTRNQVQHLIVKANIFSKLIIVLSLFLFNVPFVKGQAVKSIIVEIKTGDERFAGTNDPVHFFIGGEDFDLDNPNKDDFERNNTDTFEITVNDVDFTIELIRVVGRIGIIKTGDSFLVAAGIFKA